MWNELITNWSTQPTTTNKNKVVQNAISSFDQDYLNIDVTQLVHDMLNNPSQSFGFMLRLVDESLPARALDFCSRDYADSSTHLLLTVSVRGNPESINENKTVVNSINVYPNPAQDLLNVSFNSKNFNSSNTKLTIFNCYGQKVSETLLINQTTVIKTNSFTKGIYFYSVWKMI